MEFMRTCPPNFFDLAIVDPPYAWGNNVMNYTATPKARKNKRVRKHTIKDWNTSPPPQEYWTLLFKVSKNQIVWGGNYFKLPISRGWIFWDKKYENTNNFSAGELAWTSFDMLLKKVDVTNRIMPHQILDNIHPTQKPVALYRWTLKNYAKAGDLILDTHVGSASSLIACVELGFDYVGFEIDKEYYTMAKSRLGRATRKYELFEAV